MTEELKPCPLCNSKAEMILHITHEGKVARYANQSLIRCPQCGIKTEPFAMDLGVFGTNESQKAIEAWNKRTND